jgi:F0F1-type ATP synthase assembly protein I
MSELEDAEAAVRQAAERFEAEMAHAKAQEQGFAVKVKSHLVAIAFIIGALLGFIAGHVRL